MKKAADILSEFGVDYKAYIPVLQARRLSVVMRRLVVAAYEALHQAGLEQPDAIVVGTQWGGMQPSAALLNTLTDEGEVGMSPALFMQSTHNSPASTLAMNLHCHGFNITISHGADSFRLAKEEAERCVMKGEAENVLVCAFDETAPIWQDCLTKAGIPGEDIAKAMVIKKSDL